MSGRLSPILKAAVAGGSLVVFAVAATGSAATGTSQPAQMGSYVGCHISGKANASPGINTMPRDLTFTLNATGDNCQSSDSSIKAATVTASGTANAACSGGEGTGKFTISWDNGKQSSGTATVNFRPPFAYGMLHVTDGEFEGADGYAGALGMTSDPAACFSSGGLTELSFDGLGGLRGSE
jgi:hypothetical protein